MSTWILLVISIPVIIGILFLISIIYSKEESGFKIARALSYGACNVGSIISFILVVSMMTLTVIVLQLMAYSDLYSNNEICMPILYYFGNKDTCKRNVSRSANIQMQLYDIQKTLDHAKQYNTVRHVANHREGFQGYIAWKFSDFMLQYYKTYYSVLKQIVRYLAKIYYDLIFPWMK